MKFDQQRKSSHIVISSQAAAIFSNIITTPSEVLKVRQQRASLELSLLKKQPQFNPNSLSSTFTHIIKKEGYKTFFNGMKYNLMRTCGANFTMFLSYENIKEALLRNFTQNFVIVPVIASSVSQTLATTVTFPFEYWKTIQQSHTGSSQMKGFSLGSNLYAAYFITIKKNMMFHLVYWTISENLRKTLGYYDSQAHYKAEQKNYREVLTINAISGSIGSVIASIVTAPHDLIKTRKQICPEKYDGKTSWSIIKNIVKEEGFSKLYVGIVPSMITCVLYGACMLSIYEGTFKLLGQFNSLKKQEQLQ